MNELASKYTDRLAVLAFPCNQFGFQNYHSDTELLPSLRYVRPGDNFEPKFELFSKVAVNGSGEDKLFTWLKGALPNPVDPVDGPAGKTGDLIASNPMFPINWMPVRRSDISWNFEKFLIGKDGVPVKRYSRYYPTADIAADIDELLSK